MPSDFQSQAHDLPATAAAPEPRSRDALVLALAAGLQLLLFAWDAATPLGSSPWVLQPVPMALALLQRWRGGAWALGLSAVLFTAAGYFLSPPLPDGQVVQIGQVMLNRVLGAGSFMVVAGLLALAIGQRERLRQLMWMQQAEAALAHSLVGRISSEELGQALCAVLCQLLGAQQGVLYRRQGALLQVCGHHAMSPEALPETIAVGAGQLGQAARDGQCRLLGPLPAAHLHLHTALGHSALAHVVLLPLSAAGTTVGVIELGLIGPAPDFARVQALAERMAEMGGMALRAALAVDERKVLLTQTRQQAKELQTRQEELRAGNEDLQAQGQALRESQTTQARQQTELEEAHVQLAEHARTLELRQQALLRSRADLKQQRDALAQANRYKSEFLANMSHELRTPLNSALILSRLLADNAGGRLSAEQVRHAQTIHDANNDLLLLINDILDLSKIEAGHADLQAEPVLLDDLQRRLQALFEPQARQKGLALVVERSAWAPTSLVTDGQRLQQVLKNLLSNAVKFTAQGQVRLLIDAAQGEAAMAGGRSGGVRFEVHDTGQGIAQDKQALVFEAFRQADGSISRQHGGTGLGLSISRELVQRMGGHIQLRSSPGQGSCFSVELPAVLPPALVGAEQTPPAAQPPMQPPMQPRTQPQTQPQTQPTLAHAAVASAEGLAPILSEPEAPRPLDVGSPSGRRAGRVLMAVEDDSLFAGVLKDLVEEQGLQCVLASSGEQALALARAQPPSAILLDLGLPDVSGLSVLEQLKRDPRTRHVPVHVVSAQDRSAAALSLGAVGHLVKPVQREALVAAVSELEQMLDKPVRRVLLVEDDAPLRESLLRLLSAPDVEVVPAASQAQALQALAAGHFDCVVTDLGLPDGSGAALLEQWASDSAGPLPPAIVHTGRTLSRDEAAALRRHARSIIVKGARSPERLLDEVTLFLHSVQSRLPPAQQQLLGQARQRDAALAGRCILLAEDDVRTVFALTSVFEAQGVRLLVVRNGLEAVQRVGAESDIDLVLMDWMMPELDGLEAVQCIRQKPEAKDLPIIMLTAKAMGNDRERCLAAGASDYMAKPIDTERLLSLCRVWLRR